MSFLAPSAPQAAAPPPPPPNPPMMADAGIKASGDAARTAAAAAAGGMGFDKTLKTSPEGAPTPSTAGKALFGS